MSEEKKVLVFKCDICGKICINEIDAEQHFLDEHCDIYDDPDEEEIEEWIDENMIPIMIEKKKLQEMMKNEKIEGGM